MSEPLTPCPECGRHYGHLRGCSRDPAEAVRDDEPVRLPTYEDRVKAMADALHEDCRLEWQAIAVADPERMVTQHMADAHYGKAHDLVRRLDIDFRLTAALPDEESR